MAPSSDEKRWEMYDRFEIGRCDTGFSSIPYPLTKQCVISCEFQIMYHKFHDTCLDISFVVCCIETDCNYSKSYSTWARHGIILIRLPKSPFATLAL